MSRPRRFKVDSLADARAGQEIPLPPDEAHHARVLRLTPGAQLEVFDGHGHAWRATLSPDGASAVLTEPVTPEAERWTLGPRLILATAWPKGKRAAVLIEKCTELGVAEVVPLRCARSVVLKGAGSEGLVRLRRIAAEAAKQAGRAEVPVIAAESTFADFLGEMFGQGVTVLLDPRERYSLHEVLAEEQPSFWESGCPLAVLIGPEGGFTAEELAHADKCQVRRARLARHILRVETAAIAACAVWAAWRP